APPSAPAREGPGDRGVRRLTVPAEPTEPWAVPVVRLAAMIRRRDISSVEAVETCLARIAAVNDRLNAVVAFADDAITRAVEADASRDRGDEIGPLHGVPFTIKDSFDTEVVVSTAGTVGRRARTAGRAGSGGPRLPGAAGALSG